MKQKEWKDKEVKKYVIPDHKCTWWYRLFHDGDREDGYVAVILRAKRSRLGNPHRAEGYHVQLKIMGDCDCSLYLDLKTYSESQAKGTYNIWKEWIFDIIDDGISAEWCFERGFHLGE